LKSHTCPYIEFLDGFFGLKGILSLILIIATVFTTSAYGIEPNQFGYTIFPEKLVENTEGLIQINMLKNEIPVPIKIQDLKASSSDSDIIEIIEIATDDNSLINSIKIKARNPGTVNIALAAPGFSSKEFSVTVYGIKHNPQQLLVKSVPDSFSIDGPNNGFFTVELADEDGFPVKASEDMVISLSTSNQEILKLLNKELIIKKGEYFAITNFQVIDEGSATIYAHVKDMAVKSSLVKIGAENDLTVKLYSVPKKINANQFSKGYIIAQLQDDEGKPVIADKNIPVNYSIVGSKFKASINSSDEFKDLRASGYFEIEKGSYWGYATYSALSGLEDTYQVTISTENPLSLNSDEIEVKVVELYDDKLIQFESFPILATGNQELIGVLYLEDEDENPVIAEKDLEIKIDSSDENFVSIKNTVFKRGDSVTLVFADVGHSIPDKLELHLVAEDSKIIEPKIFGPEKESTTLIAEPLISKVLTGTDFPLAVYLKDDGRITYFSTYSQLFVSPSEFNKIEPKEIRPGDSVIVLDSKSIKDGTDVLNFETGNFNATATINNLSSSPTSVQLNYQKPILANSKNTFSLQILDGLGQPVFAEEAIEFNLVLDNNSLDVPESISIEKGKYYTLFEIESKETTKSELSILANNFPLAKFEIDSDGIKPEIVFSSSDKFKLGEIFDLSLSAKMATNPLDGVNVSWEVKGAEIQTLTSITDNDGMAMISIIPIEADKITIQASVSGLGFSDVIISKDIVVNSELLAKNESPIGVEDLLNMNNFLIILIPLILIITAVIIKKKNLMEGITEKIPFIEKLSNLPMVDKIIEIKESITQKN